MCSWDFLKRMKGRAAQATGRNADAGTAAEPNTRAQGMLAEDQALAHLQQAGLKLVTRNYRTPGRGGGEIDLIMRDRDGTLVFVEVRSRGSAQFGGAGASIGATKRRRIIFAARHYLAALPAHPPCRFDVVLIQPELLWLKSAFDAGD